jgi:hypothetical protein
MTDADSGNLTRGSRWSYIGVGCFTLPIGFFGGGMIAVLIAKIVGAAKGCTPPEGFPACNTFEFLLPGGLIGMLVLPTAALWRLRLGRKTTGSDTTGQGRV